MKKKILSLLLIMIMLMPLVPQTARAWAIYNVPDGYTIDFTNQKIYVDGVEYPSNGLPYLSGDVLNMEAGEKGSTLIGHYGTTLRITCEEGVTLTIEDLTIAEGGHDECALAFTGSGNTLILKGTNSLHSGDFEPGIRVEPGTSLEIKDNGDAAADSLTVTGGKGAAGIGGGNGSDAGNIKISGNAEVEALGANYHVFDKDEVGGAGIGSGDGGDESDAGASAANIIIQDNAIVTAYGCRGSAGIGGGDRFSGGSITITDHAQVSVRGQDGGAGIGGGRSGDGGSITITDHAQVSAEGDNGSAGIGGGYGGGGGTIDISGGSVYATKYDAGSNYDIGHGSDSGVDGTINISGDAVVFLGTDSISPQPTTTHKHVTITEDTEEYMGIPIPGEWTPTFGAYLYLSSLTYNANGGSDAPDMVLATPGENVTVTDDIGMSFTGYEFVRWDTKDTGDGISYDPGDSILMDVDKTLFAIWKEIKVEDVDITSDTEVIAALRRRDAYGACDS